MCYVFTPRARIRAASRKHLDVLRQLVDGTGYYSVLVAIRTIVGRRRTLVEMIGADCLRAGLYGQIIQHRKVSLRHPEDIQCAAGLSEREDLDLLKLIEWRLLLGARYVGPPT